MISKIEWSEENWFRCFFVLVGFIVDIDKYAFNQDFTWNVIFKKYNRNENRKIGWGIFSHFLSKREQLKMRIMVRYPISNIYSKTNQLLVVLIVFSCFRSQFSSASRHRQQHPSPHKYRLRSMKFVVINFYKVHFIKSNKNSWQ